MSGIFQTEMQVRDNEIDGQGIVNNANYFIYMAHARHLHIDSLGINFDDYIKQGFSLILIGAEMKFKDSLKPNDFFIVTSKIVPNGRIRVSFEQSVIRKSDQKVITTAINTATCININTKRPEFPSELKKALGFE